MDEVRTKLQSSRDAMTKGTAVAGGALRSGDLDQLLASAALAVLEVRCFSAGRSYSVGLCACGCLLLGCRSSCVPSTR